jgi:hypothetical protein
MSGGQMACGTQTVHQRRGRWREGRDIERERGGGIREWEEILR